MNSSELTVSNEKEFILKGTCNNVNQVIDDKLSYGKEENHFNIPWRIGIAYIHEKYIFILQCLKYRGTVDWSIEAEVELKLISRVGVHQRRKNTAIFGEFSKYAISEEEVSTCVYYGQLQFEFHVKIKKMNGFNKKLRSFDESAKEFSDIVLMVDNEKFHVLKSHLAAQCTYFRSLFYENSDESTESPDYKSKEIDPNNFQKFLEVLYGEPAINEENLSKMFHLAEIHGAKNVIRQCEEFLINLSKKSNLMMTDTTISNEINNFKIDPSEIAKAKGKQFDINHYFSNIHAMKKNSFNCGKIENHLNIAWRIFIYQNCHKELSIFLECLNLCEYKNWLIEADIGMALSSKPIHLKKHCFGNRENGSMLYRVPRNADLNSLAVLFRVKVTNVQEINGGKVRSFNDKAVKEVSDVVLAVNDTKFHVAKKYLAFHSSYFQSLFADNPGQQITLKDVNPDDFQGFLEVLHGDSVIYEYNVEKILKLADMFDSKTAFRRCEEFYIRKWDKSLSVKFEIAVKNKMDKLKKSCLSQVKTFDDIRSFLPEDVTQLDHSVWAVLVKTAISLRKCLSYPSRRPKPDKKGTPSSKISNKKITKPNNFPKIDESAEKLSDVVLCVNNKKFYVQKAYLASHSTYFDSLFFGQFRESEKTQIPLKGIDPYDFQNFLEVLRDESVVDENTIDGILYLADMYDSELAMRKCEAFLDKSSLKTRFHVAIRNNMEHLKKKCLSEMRTSGDVLSVLPKDATQFHYLIWEELLNKVFEL